MRGVTALAQAVTSTRRLEVGTVVDATATTLRFRVDGRGGALYGPARYPRPTAAVDSAAVGDHGSHTHQLDDTDTPPAGTVVVAIWPDNAPDTPYVIALYGWPGT